MSDLDPMTQLIALREEVAEFSMRLRRLEQGVEASTADTAAHWQRIESGVGSMQVVTQRLWSMVAAKSARPRAASGRLWWEEIALLSLSSVLGAAVIYVFFLIGGAS